MNGFTFSPALGWVAGGLLAAGLAVLAILEIALFVRRRASSDENVRRVTFEVCSPSVMRYSTIASSGCASRIDFAVSST